MFDWMALVDHHVLWWYQSAPSGTFHQCMRLGVVWGKYGYHCHLTPSISDSWRFYLATLGGYLSPSCLHVPQTLSLVCDCLTLLLVLPSDPLLQDSSILSWSTATECSWQYWNSPTAAGLWITPPKVHPQLPRAGVNMETVSNSCDPAYRHNAIPPGTQPPILYSTCWIQWYWAAPFIWHIALRTFWCTSDYLGLNLLPHQGVMNYRSHCLHRIHCRITRAMVAHFHSQQCQYSAVPLPAGILALGGSWWVSQ